MSRFDIVQPNVKPNRFDIDSSATSSVAPRMAPETASVPSFFNMSQGQTPSPIPFTGALSSRSVAPVTDESTPATIASDQGTISQIGKGIDYANQFGSDFWNPSAPATTPGGAARNYIAGLPGQALQNIKDKAAQSSSVPQKKPNGTMETPQEAQHRANLATVNLASGFVGSAPEDVSKIIKNIPEKFFNTIAKESDPKVIEGTLNMVGLDPANSEALAQKLSTANTVNDVKDVLAAHEPVTPTNPTPQNAPGTPQIEAPTPIKQAVKQYKTADDFVNSIKQDVQVVPSNNSRFLYHVSETPNIESMTPQAPQKGIYFSPGAPSRSNGYVYAVDRSSFPKNFFEADPNGGLYGDVRTLQNIPKESVIPLGNITNGKFDRLQAFKDFYNKSSKPTTPSLFNQPNPPFESKPIFSGSQAQAIEAPKAATPIEKADSQLSTAAQNNPQHVASLDSLGKVIDKSITPANERVNVLDYLRTPENVLKKMGMGQNAVDLRNAYDSYLRELPKNIDKVTEWSKQAPTPEDNLNIFRALDGKSVNLTPVQAKVVGEIKPWLSQWADRLGMKPDERLSDYITHIFPPGKGGELNEDIAKLISGKVPGSVYDPYLLKRKGVEGYIEDTWRALDAYVKTATRKVHMDPALDALKKASSDLELSQSNYVKRFADRVNMRPTELDNLIDNGIKSVAGYRLGVRPTKNITSTARKIVSRAKLGLSFTSAFKNLTQGINTFSELGTKYTTKGYIDLLTKGTQELKDNGVLLDHFVQDRTYNAVKKFWEKFDRVTFYNFEATETINRGAAYYGGKAKALAEGKTEAQAIDAGKEAAGKTQFRFGSIDTPVALGSDIMKTVGQFQNYSIKQIEFLAGKLKNKEYASLARYIGAAAVVFGTIGGAFGMSLWDILPSVRVGTPPTADLPVRLFKDATGAKDQYGRTPTGAARLRDAANALLTDVVPGGTQLNRTAQGIQAVNQGKSTTAAGHFQYSIPQTPVNYARAALFGKSNLPQAQSYYNKKSAPKASASSRFNIY